MALDNKISNIIGVRIPEWIYRQILTRSSQNSKSSRDNNNLIYLANKTAWIRLVSSVNIKDPLDRDYFSQLGVSMGEETSLAQEFTLFGGTSTYINKKAQLRSGLGKGKSYGTLGETEIQKYGYRPMPGITRVDVQTKGRLGSVREAIVDFKCWDKDQLDIMDALYFKLGYTMFLEWGHTYYYPSKDSVGNPSNYDPEKVRSTEFNLIDPFISNLGKEEILKQIAEKKRECEGNYDAILGIVTNFNFSLNQEGGYDCQIKITGLGALADSIKINNPTSLPDILEGQIKEYNNTLDQIAKAKEAEEELKRKKQEEEEKAKLEALDRIKNLTLKELVAEIPYPLRNYSYPSNVPVGNVDIANATIKTDKFGNLFIIKKLNGFIPLDENLYKTVTIQLDSLALFKLISEFKITFSEIQYWELEGASVVDIIKEAIPDFDISGLSLNKSFSENYKILVKNVPAVRLLEGAFNLSNPASFTTTTAISNVKNAKYKINKKYTSEYDRNIVYDLEISRNVYAVSSDPNAVSQYYRVGANAFYDAFTNYIINNFLPLDSIKILDVLIDGKSGVEFVLKLSIPISGKSKVKKTKASLNIVEGETEEISAEEVDVVYNLETIIRIQDTYLIKSFTSFNSDGVLVDQPADFLSYEKQLKDQNQGDPTEGDEALDQDPNAAAEKSPLSYLSSLELILRTIQVHSLTEAIKNTGNDLDIQNTVQAIPLSKDFVKQIFSNGIFTPFIEELVSNQIVGDESYDTLNIESIDQRLKIQAKYGFATNLMANTVPLYEKTGARNFDPVNFSELLTAFVVPYRINQEIETGTQLNHPVYISLGSLLMILNHSCTIYDSKGGAQRPLVYIDFNPNHNFCLSNPNQLTTDPLTCLIPFEGTNEDYFDLFDDKVLDETKKQIQPLEGSEQGTPLFTPDSDVADNRDNLSDGILPFKYAQGNNVNPYRAHVMNILISVDYLMTTIKSYSTKNEENRVFLKPFLEQILVDVAKKTGNFNIFRLSYNDNGNTLQIVDDQIVPPTEKERQMQSNMPDNNPKLPLFGKESIAKRLDVRTEISSKLTNMLAISANSNPSKKSTLSNQGDYFGYINTNYIDRYIPSRTEVTTGENDVTESEKNVAIQFNSTISSFYNSIDPSQQQIGFATNYFINKITNIKGNNEATRASAMIPVSVNFSTDGISGLTMGQGFTVPDQILPYTYNTRTITDNDSGDTTKKNIIDKVGFVIVGLNHTIENNVWDTSVKASMIFLKDSKAYQTYEFKKQEPGKLQGSTQVKNKDENGNLAKWENGEIVGYEKPIPFKGVTVLEGAYSKLKELIDGAATQGIKLNVVSAYRSYDSQLQLRRNNVKDKSKAQDLSYLKNAEPSQFEPVTGRPGYSNHQNGVGFDIQTATAEGKKAYEWLVANAIKYNFVRTVPSERWHWEYRPEIQDQYARVPKGPNWNYNGDSNSNTA